MGIELHDNRGLICGFRLQAQGPAVAVDVGALVAREPPDGPTWLHFNFNDARARNWVGGCDWLPVEGREWLLSNDRGVHVETWGNALAGALADIFADDPERFGFLHVYLDQNCLISGRHHQLTVAGVLRAELVGGLAIDGTTVLFNRLLAHLVDIRAKAVAGYAELLDNAEDRVLAGDFGEIRLGQSRRSMARLRRQLVADRHAFVDFVSHPPNWWGKAATKDLRRIAASLVSVGQDLELTEDRARLLSEEIDSRLVERTNRNLYFVTVAAAIFLPITIISGIFGMNVGGLPWLEDASGFLWAMGCMAGSVAVTFALMAWRGML